MRPTLDVNTRLTESSIDLRDRSAIPPFLIDRPDPCTSLLHSLRPQPRPQPKMLNHQTRMSRIAKSAGPLWWRALHTLARQETKKAAKSIALLLRLFPCFSCRRTILFMEATLAGRETPLSVQDAVKLVWFGRDMPLRVEQLHATVNLKLGVTPAWSDRYLDPEPSELSDEDVDALLAIVQRETLSSELTSDQCARLRCVEGDLTRVCAAAAANVEILQEHYQALRELYAREGTAS